MLHNKNFLFLTCFQMREGKKAIKNRSLHVIINCRVLQILDTSFLAGFLNSNLCLNSNFIILQKEIKIQSNNGQTIKSMFETKTQYITTPIQTHTTNYLHKNKY